MGVSKNTRYKAASAKLLVHKHPQVHLVGRCENSCWTRSSRLFRLSYVMFLRDSLQGVTKKWVEKEQGEIMGLRLSVGTRVIQ